jgi:uncharacterized protein YjlB
MTEHVYDPPTHDGSEGLLAIIYRPDEPGVPADRGINFLTDPGLSLQVAVVRHPPGHAVPAHVHLSHLRPIVRTMEVLIVTHGRAELDLYNSAGAWVAVKELFPGHVVTLVAGGHALRVPGGGYDFQFVEVKQGPYPGRDKDKVPIDPKR